MRCDRPRCAQPEVQALTVGVSLRLQASVVEGSGSEMEEEVVLRCAPRGRWVLDGRGLFRLRPTWGRGGHRADPKDNDRLLEAKEKTMKY